MPSLSAIAATGVAVGDAVSGEIATYAADSGATAVVVAGEVTTNAADPGATAIADRMAGGDSQIALARQASPG
jgi:hypothetical protein